jgi:protein gp37
MPTQPELIIDNCDAAELAECERVIEITERDAFLKRGLALGKIRDSKLYRDRYQTFEGYCDERWELKHSRVHQLIEAAKLAQNFHNCGSLMPVRESHIRPLLVDKLTDDDRLALWREVLDAAKGQPRNVKAADVENAVQRFTTGQKKEYITLDEWNELHPDLRLSGSLEAIAGNEGLNRQTNTDIEWADWSWNPVTGCLHGCPYCYARDIAFNIYPREVGFGATVWPTRLNAPRERHPNGQGAAKNIFVCSMADLFGRWVPARWIEAVLTTVDESPQWNFLFLTKFPKRMSEFEIPANAWMGTTVDLQARVANAEKAFENVKAGVRWLSIEPMLEPLQFTRLDLFDWIVIGGASPSKAIDGTPATPAWNIPIDWLVDLHQQARAANCKIYYKTNSGLAEQAITRIREYPGSDTSTAKTPAVFDYLRAIPKKEQIG